MIIRRILGGIFRKCWRLTHPTIYLHSGDLMLPTKADDSGITAVQLIVMTRLLDTISYYAGDYKHHDFGELIDIGENKSGKGGGYESYYDFIKSLDEKGFNPKYGSVPVGLNPFFGLEQGTHRMGWLLYHRLNTFIPIKLHPPTLEMYFPQEGAVFFEKSGVPAEDITRVIKEYYSLLDKMQKEITAVFDSDVFISHEQDIMEICSLLGDCKIRERTKAVYFPKKLRKHTRVRSENVAVVTIVLQWNELYYKRCYKVKSRRIDEITNKIKNKLKISNFYIAPTITESVLLEDILYSVAANVK